MKFAGIVFIVLFSLNSFSQFSPNELNPALWLDASDSNQIVLSGSKVQKWMDKSGNENHAIAPSPVNQPVYLSSNLGISFDGIDDLLLSNDIPKGSDNSITVFALAKAGMLSGSEQLKKWIVSKGSYTGGAPYGLLQNYGGIHAVVAGKTINMKNDDMKMHVLCLKYNGQSISSELDGIEFPEEDVAPQSNSKKVGIGCDEDEKYPFEGVICEVLIFQKKLDECEVSKINGYLANKWTEATLTNLHPFSNGPVDFCEGFSGFSINENAPNGTSLGVPEIVNVLDTSSQIDKWQISYQLFDGMFSINSNTGEITLTNNTYLDYEQVKAILLKIMIESQAGVNEIEFNISINDEDDGGSLKQTSLLWGEEGELWDPRGRLPDFSFAGYNSGELEIPTFLEEIDVIANGVIPNDGLSDVATIQNIINNAPDNTSIIFPAGKYVIDAPLIIKRSNIVLKGVSDENNGTVFYMPQSATEYYGSYDGGYSTGDEGYFVLFDGGWNGTKCTIMEDVKRGDRTITVNKISDLKVNDVINITGNGDNPQNGELWHELHNNQAEDWDCTLGWSSGNGGPMYHKIERIEGNLITLREPLRINMKASWEMEVQQAAKRLINVGIENIKIDFPVTTKQPHLDEPGYNGVKFLSCVNFWAKNLCINNCDNGINAKRSSYGEISDIVFVGRDAHHPIKFAYSSNNVAYNIDFQNDKEHVHSVTFTHKANNNVLYNVKGSKPVSLDFHRNAPFSNLICDVRSEWNYNSSGTYCAGPHAGARNVYWNMFGEAGEISAGNEIWGQYQNTVVSNLSISDKLHPEREWYENVENVTPANLYLSQLNKRVSAPEEPLFMEDSDIGDRSNWFERDPSRWRIEEIEGEIFYSLFFNDFPSLSGGKPGEYAIYDSVYSGDFEMAANVISNENFDDNLSADIILIIDFVDDDNYAFGRISSNTMESGIFRIANGIVTEIQPSTAHIAANLAHKLSIKREGSKTTLYLDNVEVATTNKLTSLPNGKLGIGSSNDAVLFDNVEIGLLTVGAISIEKEQLKPLVYPVPSSNIVNISTNQVQHEAVLYNTNMQVLKSGIKNSFDISGLPNGVYYLEIITGNSRFIERVIKQ